MHKNIPPCGSEVNIKLKYWFCDCIAPAGPLKYALKAFLISIVSFEDQLNDLPLTSVMAW